MNVNSSRVHTSFKEERIWISTWNIIEDHWSELHKITIVKSLSIWSRNGAPQTWHPNPYPKPVPQTRSAESIAHLTGPKKDELGIFHSIRWQVSISTYLIIFIESSFDALGHFLYHSCSSKFEVRMIQKAENWKSISWIYLRVWYSNIGIEIKISFLEDALIILRVQFEVRL